MSVDSLWSTTMAGLNRLRNKYDSLVEENQQLRAERDFDLVEIGNLRSQLEQAQKDLKTAQRDWARTDDAILAAGFNVVQDGMDLKLEER